MCFHSQFWASGKQSKELQSYIGDGRCACDADCHFWGFLCPFSYRLCICRCLCTFHSRLGSSKVKNDALWDRYRHPRKLRHISKARYRISVAFLRRQSIRWKYFDVNYLVKSMKANYTAIRVLDMAFVNFHFSYINYLTLRATSR